MNMTYEIEFLNHYTGEVKHIVTDERSKVIWAKKMLDELNDMSAFIHGEFEMRLTCHFGTNLDEFESTNW